MKAKRLGQFAEALGLSGETLRRFVVLLLFATWFGGFTFFSAVVIPAGTRTLGSHEQMGFITQTVTTWLNGLGVAALCVLLWNCVAAWPDDRPLLGWGLGGSWVVMVAVQVALFATHATLDQMLDTVNHRVHDRAHFRAMHALYVNLSQVQWGAALLHWWCLAAVWRHLDRTGRRPAA